MRYLKLFEEYNGSYHREWVKYLPESFTFIKGDKTFTRYKSKNIMNHADMIQIMYEPKSSEWGEPDDLQFDLYFIVDNGIRIDVDITFGDLQVCEFSVESPNKVNIIEYTSYGSKFDPSNTVFAFTERSLLDLIKFFNNIDNRLQLTRDKFNFLDVDPYSHREKREKKFNIYCMKNIKTYEQFNQINEEEISKKSLLTAGLAATSLAPANLKAKEADRDMTKKEISYKDDRSTDSETTASWPKKPHIAKRKVTSREQVEKLESIGWTLDSMKSDTLWREVTKQKPDTVVTVTEIKFNDDQFFASGRYILDQSMKDSIDATLLDIINKGGIISAIQVESSTDKQRLSPRLQEELSNLGYQPNNTGLSKKRADGVKDHLIDFGVDSSIIETIQKVEAGTGTIDASARYVLVKIAYLEKEVSLLPEVVEKVPEVKEVFYLSKEFAKTKSVDKKKISHKVKSTKKPIKTCKSRTKCFEF